MTETVHDKPSSGGAVAVALLTAGIALGGTASASQNDARVVSNDAIRDSLIANTLPALDGKVSTALREAQAKVKKAHSPSASIEERDGGIVISVEPPVLLSPESYPIPKSHLTGFTPQEEQLFMSELYLLKESMPQDDERLAALSNIKYRAADLNKEELLPMMAQNIVVWGIMDRGEVAVLDNYISVNPEALQDYFQMPAVLGHELGHATFHCVYNPLPGESVRFETEAMGMELNDLLRLQQMLKDGEGIEPKKVERNGELWNQLIEQSIGESEGMYWNYYVRYDLSSLSKQLSGMADYLVKRDSTIAVDNFRTLVAELVPYYSKGIEGALDVKRVRKCFEKALELFKNSPILRSHPSGEKFLNFVNNALTHIDSYANH